MKTHTFRSKPELIAILVIAFFCFMAANCHPRVKVAEVITDVKATGAIPENPAKEAIVTGANRAVSPTKVSTEIASAATILARQEVPILCYHQIRDYKPTDSKVAMTYICPPAAFHDQLKVL